MAPCPACNNSIRIAVFPALLRAQERIAAEIFAVSEGEASCYNHVSKRAAVSCNHCGRFLCLLCAIEVSGQNWCPDCLLNAKVKHNLREVQSERTLYDSIALSLATFPFLVIYPAFVTAPLAIFLSIRFWKKPGSLVPRTKIRFILALLFSIAEIGLLAAMILLVIYQSLHSKRLS